MAGELANFRKLRKPGYPDASGVSWAPVDEDGLVYAAACAVARKAKKRIML
jgi:hypothetical protein